MNVERYKTPTLHKMLEKQREKLENQSTIDNEKCKNIDFGYGMRAYSRLKHLSFRKSDKIKENIRAIQSEIKRRDDLGKGVILSFKEFKQSADWREKQYSWHIYWKGKKVCEQPKGDLNIVNIRRYYNNNFVQYQLPI